MSTHDPIDPLSGADSLPETAREVLGYLLDNPEAQDTLEGIAEWWVLERCVERRLREVREALGALLSQGLLVERGGQVARYRLATDRVDEIQRIVEESR